jgi:bacterial/archaeal transporter family protein
MTKRDVWPGLQRPCEVVLQSWRRPPPTLWACLIRRGSYLHCRVLLRTPSTICQMDPILGGVILQFVAACVGNFVYLGQGTMIAMNPNIPSSTVASISRNGVQWCIAAGFAVGAAELLSFIVSGKGVPATQSIPIIVGGSIVVGTTLGTVWLQERLSPRGWIGVVLIAAGILFVATDPSSCSLGH